MGLGTGLTFSVTLPPSMLCAADLRRHLVGRPYPAQVLFSLFQFPCKRHSYKKDFETFFPSGGVSNAEMGASVRRLFSRARRE